MCGEKEPVSAAPLHPARGVWSSQGWSLTNHEPRCESQSRPFPIPPAFTCALTVPEGLPAWAPHTTSTRPPGEHEMAAASEVISGKEPRRGLWSQCCRLRSLRAGLRRLLHNQTGFGYRRPECWCGGDHPGSHTAFETYGVDAASTEKV